MGRIDIFTRYPQAQSRENYGARELQKAFERCEISHASFCLAQDVLADYLSYFSSNPAKGSLAFEDVFPGGGPLCDLLEIPHVLWTNGLAEGAHYLQSPFAKLVLDDENLCLHLQKKGHKNIFFLPFGISEELKDDPEKERSFDVVMFEELIDVAGLEKRWEALFASAEVQLIEQTVSACLKNPQAIIFDVVEEQLKGRSASISMGNMLFLVEEYLKAAKILPLVEAFEGVRVDLFGEHVGNNWLRRLKNAECIYPHGSLPYTEYFSILKKSKILSADKKSPWYLPALACGCLLVEDHEVHEYLKKPKMRVERVRESQKNLFQEHSWDNRAKRVLEILSAH